MRIEELTISEDNTVLDAMRQLDATGRRILFVAPGGQLRALVTDADVRKYILKGGALSGPVRDMANYAPKTLPMDCRAEARAFLLENSIDAVPLLDKAGCIADVVFVNELDIDAHKNVGIPVVIMAGGLGTRLYPYTKILPKPLIPVGELPIVEHIINRFCQFGCDDFRLIVNYKKNMIKSYLNDLEKDYRVEYIEEDTPLGTGGGLSLLKGSLNGPFFLTNCDVLVDADFSDLYNYHRENKNVVTMVCAVKHLTIPYGVIELGKNGEIDRITEKPEMNFLTNTGIYVADASVLEHIEEGVQIGFPDVIEQCRKAGERVGVYPVSENSWMDMGQLEELEKMRRRLEQQ